MSNTTLTTKASQTSKKWNKAVYEPMLSAATTHTIISLAHVLARLLVSVIPYSLTFPRSVLKPSVVTLNATLADPLQSSGDCRASTPGRGRSEITRRRLGLGL